MNPPAPSTDATGVAAFFTRHAAAVLRLCRRLTSSEPDAEDARQEAFLQLQRHWSRLDPESNPVGWLFRTAAHASLKIRNRRAPTPMTDAEDRVSAAPVLDGDDRRNIAAAMRALPREYRTLIQE